MIEACTPEYYIVKPYMSTPVHKNYSKIQFGIGTNLFDLYHTTELKCTYVKNNTKCILILGSLLKNGICDSNYANDMLSAYMISEEKLHEFMFDASGKYVVIFGDNVHMDIVGDATNSLNIFYFKKETLVSSSINTIAEILSLNDKDVSDFVNFLHPNHKLSILGGFIKRIFPTQNCLRTGYTSLVNSIHNTITSELKYYSTKGPLNIIIDSSFYQYFNKMTTDLKLDASIQSNSPMKKDECIEMDGYINLYFDFIELFNKYIIKNTKIDNEYFSIYNPLYLTYWENKLLAKNNSDYKSNIAYEVCNSRSIFASITSLSPFFLNMRLLRMELMKIAKICDAFEFHPDFNSSYPHYFKSGNLNSTHIPPHIIYSSVEGVTLSLTGSSIAKGDFCEVLYKITTPRNEDCTIRICLRVYGKIPAKNTFFIAIKVNEKYVYEKNTFDDRSFSIPIKSLKNSDCCDLKIMLKTKDDFINTSEECFSVLIADIYLEP